MGGCGGGGTGGCSNNVSFEGGLKNYLNKNGLPFRSSFQKQHSGSSFLIPSFSHTLHTPPQTHTLRHQHTRTRAHTHTHARTRTHTHTHTHMRRASNGRTTSSPSSSVASPSSSSWPFSPKDILGTIGTPLTSSCLGHRCQVSGSKLSLIFLVGAKYCIQCIRIPQAWTCFIHLCTHPPAPPPPPPPPLQASS